MANAWVIALKKWNEGRAGQKYKVPAKGTPEYDEVKKLMAGVPKSEKVEKAKAKDVMIVDAKSATVKAISKKEVEVKIVAPSKVETPAPVKPDEPKRGRGRPRKTPAVRPAEPTMRVEEVPENRGPVVSALEAAAETVSEPTPAPKRRVGRPKKEKVEAPKRKVGRPRKEKVEEEKKEKKVKLPKGFKEVKVVRPPQAEEKKEEPKESKIAEVGKRILKRKAEETAEMIRDAKATGLADRAIADALKELMAEVKATKDEIKAVKEEAKETKKEVKNAKVEKAVKKELKKASKVAEMDSLSGEAAEAFDKLKAKEQYTKYFKKVYLMNQAIIQAITDGVVGVEDMELLRELENGNKVYQLPISLITKKPGSAVKNIDVVLDEDGGVFGVLTDIELVKDVPLRVQNAAMKRPFGIYGKLPNPAKGQDIEELAEKDKDLKYEEEEEEEE
jgi:hypothetical protein